MRSPCPARWLGGKVIAQQPIVLVPLPGAFLLAHGDELVAPAGERGEPLACGVGRDLAPRCETAAQFGEHDRVDRVGLRAPADGAGEVARLFRVDPGMADARRAERAAQDRVVTAGGLEHDEAIARGERGRQIGHGRRRVGDPPGGAGLPVVDVEMELADIDPKHVRV